MTEYCYLNVDTWPVFGDARKQRGWRNDGIQAVVSQAMPSADVVFHELAAVEGGSLRDWYPSWELRQAFLALLDRLAVEGWTVADFTPADTFFAGGYMGRRAWPFGDFLLVRES